ncbi:nucleotidyl transferase AbiEii/AbiGii toxin family protein [Corynebacterium sp. SCR221107]|uniref:nucleotidyl transferase AbiEii/AbiGii toxin family protein n=1 Tax=Corynebacterium sp. SCR221107 TaxID=3017361 RepID=UPI0022EC5CAD|nr:nucleotidyl transferase AbiEii/AbiGii toxin family protein [Corynebacterium sp. SCR221107]WBT08976.1 nucleotidyl transferase AbiEii/AbiGii toxin family protein [Corynebacterium sp. SCR221107]
MTEDIDLAIAVDSWDNFEELKTAFPSSSGAWQEICVGGIRVDVVPFGTIEKPPGKIAPVDGFVLNVAGMQQVFTAAEPYQLDSETEILLPTVPGLGAMKLHSWLDRREKGISKDAADVALIFTWLEDDEVILWREYLEVGPSEFEGEPEVMAAFLLGNQVGRLLGTEQGCLLLKRFEVADEEVLELLAQELGTLEGSSLGKKIRMRQVEAMVEGLRSAVKE